MHAYIPFYRLSSLDLGMHMTTFNEERDHEFEKKQGRVYGMVGGRYGKE